MPAVAALKIRSAMKRHVAATLLVLTTLGVLNAHVDVEAQDGRYFGVWLGKKHDVIGWVADHRNQLQRDCSAVERLSVSSPAASQVLSVIGDYSPPDSRHVQLVSLQQLGPWLVAELNFAQLNPAVVLLQLEGEGLHLPERAIWSGSTAPWWPGPRIRSHLQATAAPGTAQAVSALLACYEPASPGLN